MGKDPYQLTVRDKDWGLRIQPVSTEWPGGSDPAEPEHAHTRLIFFIHGYNNILPTARRNWRDKTLGKLHKYNKLRNHLDNVVLFYWPGDVSKYTYVSALSYPIIVGIVPKAAEELTAYLERLKSPNSEPVKLQFIAHSLGCRLVLDTLARIKAQKDNGKLKNIEVEDVLLMAAAVPSGLCIPDSNGPFNKKVATGHEVILYSYNDGALKWFPFQVGQALRFEPVNFLGYNPVAVGRSGKPFGRWSKYSEETGLGHGDYWNHPYSIDKMADLILRPLLSPANRDRSLSNRKLPIRFEDKRRPTQNRQLHLSILGVRSL